MSNKISHLSADAVDITNQYIETARFICMQNGWKPTCKNVQIILNQLVFFQQNVNLESIVKEAFQKVSKESIPTGKIIIEGKNDDSGI